MWGLKMQNFQDERPLGYLKANALNIKHRSDFQRITSVVVKCSKPVNILVAESKKRIVLARLAS